MEIEVVFFDAAGTLIALREPVGETYARWARLAGPITGVDPVGLEVAFRREYREMPPMTGSAEDWWRALVRRVFVANGLAPLPESEFRNLFAYYKNGRAWRLYPEVIAVLESLRARGLALGVISNFDERLHAIVEDLGIADYFEHVITSVEAGSAKPDSRIFDAAVERFGVRPEACLHAGDDPEADWRGAEGAGLRAFPVQRPGKDLSELSRILGTAD